jgi:hypothetical protein
MIRTKIVANGEAAELNGIFIRILHLLSILKTLRTIYVCFEESKIVEHPLNYNNLSTLESVVI